MDDKQLAKLVKKLSGQAAKPKRPQKTYDSTLDAIDQIVPPGTTIHDADRGWVPPWMEPSRRRIPNR